MRYPESHRVKIASPDDEHAIRALLRNAVMDGEIQITLEREPNAGIAARVEGMSHHTVLVLDAENDEILGMGSRSCRPLYVDGRVRSVGYLGQLRAAPGRRGIRRLTSGFKAVSALREQSELPYDITSIVADNNPAIRLLERGFKDIPPYRKYAELTTFIITTSNKDKSTGEGLEAAKTEDVSAIATCLQEYLSDYQYAPYWDQETLADKHSCKNLSVDDFLVMRHQNRITSCLAIWDQQGFKQVVIKGYSKKLRLFRPSLNCLLKIIRKPTLPKAPKTVNMAYLSHLAIENNDTETFIALVNRARYIGKQRGLDYLVLGLSDKHPLHDTMLSKFSSYQYRSNLYQVLWDDAAPFRNGAKQRIPHVEVAIL